ncbi:MAG: hypothetical protein FWF87_02265 [Synergistaceae bacterium]|nr:hypothetical protein [Synergistaceae bacterium]
MQNVKDISSRILDNLDSEPHVLFVGESFDLANEENLRILKQKWWLIITSQRDLALCNAVTKALPSYRQVRLVSIDDPCFPKQRNLKICYLFGTPEIESVSRAKPSQRDQKTARKALERVLDDRLKNGGSFIFVGYSENDAFITSEMQDFLYSVKRDSSVIFFGVKDILVKEILPERDMENEDPTPILCLSEEFTVPDDSVNDEYDNSYSLHYESDKTKVYVAGKACFIDKKDLVRFNEFATLLTEEEINRRIVLPQYIETEFSSFLKESTTSPAWYGYKNKFNLVRAHDEELFKRVNKGLKNPGTEEKKQDNYPICLKGEPSSGKSVAVAYLAYRVFYEKEYPVIFINKKDIDFHREVMMSPSGRIENADGEMNVLDNVLHQLEKIGAKCSLVIWDLSAFTSDMLKCRSLCNYIKHTRARNVQFVFTAYENADKYESIDEHMTQQITKSVKKTYFQFLETNKSLNMGDDSLEINHLKQILSRKARWEQVYIDKVIEQLKKSEELRNNFMLFLYTSLTDTRLGIEKGMGNYIENVIQYSSKDFVEKLIAEKYETSQIKIALKNSGFITNEKGQTNNDEDKIINNIKKALVNTAICTKYDLFMPFSLILRLINLYDHRVKEVLSSMIYLTYDEYEFSDYAVRFRTRGEAMIYLRSQKIIESEEVNQIVNIIMTLNYNDKTEVNLIVKLLIRIGPNSKDFQRLTSEEYEKIIDALRESREQGSLLSPLVVQEASYIREYIKMLESENRHINDNKQKMLRDAVIICNEAIQIEKRHGQISSRLLTSLVVERVNCCINLMEYENKYDEREYMELSKDLDEQLGYAPDNGYIISTKLWLTLKFCDKLPQAKTVELLASADNLIRKTQDEYVYVAQDSNFINPAEGIYRKIDSSLSDEYINSLIIDGNPYAVYLKVAREMETAGITKRQREYENRIEAFNNDQALRCREICAKYYDENEYAVITIKDHICQRQRLKLKWIAYNKTPIFTAEEQFTAMTNDQWKDILGVCRDFCGNQDCTPKTLLFFYVMALANLHLEQYSAYGQTINKIRNCTELVEQRGNDRIRTKHILCDEKGKPLEFSGNFNQNTPDNVLSGNYVRIGRISRDNNGGRDIYFRKWNIKGIEIKSGVSCDDFQLGLGYMGLAAFRGLTPKDGQANE